MIGTEYSGAAECGCGVSMAAANEPVGVERGSAPEAIARELTGDLPCAWCGYNLKGLSVRGKCPECGAAVRATILARVDPYAEVLLPITRPRLTAVGVLLWAWGSLAAAVMVWSMRIVDGAAVLWSQPLQMRWLGIAGTACLGLATIGSLVLVKPHGRIGLGNRLAACAGVAAMAGATIWYRGIHVVFDPMHLKPYFMADGMLADRVYMRLVMGALLVVALFSLRPNARLLAARSLLLRMGKVDRQTMRAMALAVVAAMTGDVMLMLGDRLPDVATSLAVFLIAAGSMLFTVGLIGVVVDTMRIVPVLLRGPVSIGSVLGGKSA